MVCRVTIFQRVVASDHQSGDIKVLFYAESWMSGGIERTIINTIEQLTKENYSFDVFSVHDRDSVFDRALAELGVNRFTLFPSHRPGLVKRLIEGTRGFRDILKQGSYSVVHIDTMNGTGFIYAYIAHKLKVPVRIVHSHNSDVGEGGKQIKRLLHSLFNCLYGGNETDRLACSAEAGRYMFGNKPFLVINNGIDIKRFAFDESSRKTARSELGVPREAVLFGSTSRIAPAKNPLFQLEVFFNILKYRPSAYYLLMKGEGDLEKQVENRAKQLGVNERLVRYEARPDVERLYCALDLMLFPSLFEGLSCAAIEAQCSGLPILASSGISEETAVTDLLHFKNLMDGAEGWARTAVSLVDRCVVRTTYAAQVAFAGFDMRQTAQQIDAIYRKAKSNP